MAENTPYGPDQLPWKDTVALIAISNGEYLVSPPSRDPNDLYDFPEAKKASPRTTIRCRQGHDRRSNPKSSGRDTQFLQPPNAELFRIPSDAA